jgi:hypothetical protein
MPKTFDYYRSTNGRLHATLDQEDNYGRYLKRIEMIVNKKPNPDFSTSQYMTFLNKCRLTSKNHRSQEKLSQINTENQILLDKIICTKKRTANHSEERHLLAMHEKRFRVQERINEENKRIALRVVNQESKIDHRLKELLPFR